MTCAIHTNTLLEHMYQLIRMAIKKWSLGNIALNWRISSLHEINYAHEIEWKMWFYLLRDSKVVAISSVQMAQLIWQSFDKFSLELTPWSGLLLLVLTWCYLFLVITDLIEFLFKLKRRHDLDNRKKLLLRINLNQLKPIKCNCNAEWMCYLVGGCWTTNNSICI